MIHPVIKKTHLFSFFFFFFLNCMLNSTPVSASSTPPLWSLVPSFDRIKASKMTMCLWNCNNWVHMTRRLKPTVVSNLWPRHEWSIYLCPWTADHGPAVEPAEFISLNKDKDIQYFLREKKKWMWGWAWLTLGCRRERCEDGSWEQCQVKWLAQLLLVS